ncbi:MAG: hypothetical protein IJU50_05750 [Lachnospiraceae bacterium]|nr:hypothetical protein [Lachnospiraceae bacterium]
MDSRELFREQENRTITRTLTEEEMRLGNAPLISLADMRQLQNVGPALDAQEQRLQDMRTRTQQNMPPVLQSGANIGNLRQEGQENPLTETYISITSGYSITALKDDLFGLWKYQRFNNKDSADMQDLKAKLTALTDQFSMQVSFSNREDVRDRCGEMREKYQALVLSCEHYLSGHKSPWTIAGKARKSMAEKLLKASQAELDMLEDSAMNCFEEAKAVSSGEGAVSMQWDRILHNGRIRTINTERDHITLKRRGNSNVTEILREGTNEREILTVARNEQELQECRKIVAMSRLAQALGCGNLSGGEEMNTRMTTMIIDGKTVQGCITSGVTKKTMEDYRRENAAVSRPGADVLDQRQASYSAEHLQGLLILPFLDYLCGVNDRAESDINTGKTETSRGVSLGRIQANAHGKAGGAFGQEAEPFPGTLQNVWMDTDFAEKILQMDGSEIYGMLTGVLEDNERQAVLSRFHNLQDKIRETAGIGGMQRDEQGVAHLNRDPLPQNFKDRAALEEQVRHPDSLAAYAQSQENGFHKLLNASVLSNAIANNQTGAEPNLFGQLVPLGDLVREIKSPAGDSVLSEIVQNLPGMAAAFEEKRREKVPFGDGRDAVLLAINSQLLDIKALQDACRTYLKRSKGEGDFSNRYAVGRLLSASEYQERLYKEHAAAMYGWVQRLGQQHTDRDFSMTFEELFKESMTIAQRRGNAGSFDVGDMYQNVTLSEQELCEKTGTEGFGTLGAKLHHSLKSREDRGKTNSEIIKNVYDRLQEVREYQNSPLSRGFNGFVDKLNGLVRACNEYITKQEEHLLGGRITSDGRERLDIVDELQDMIQEEFNTIFERKEDGRIAVREAEVERLANSCVSDTKTRDQVTFLDISLALKRNLLMEQEMAYSQGRSLKAKERNRQRSRRSNTEQEAERLRQRAGKGPESFVEKDPVSLEKELAAKSGKASLNELADRLDVLLENRKKNSKEIMDCADLLNELAELKNEPIFTQYDRNAYNEALESRRAGVSSGSDPDIRLQNNAVSQMNRFVDKMNAFVRARDAYLDKQNSRIFGGTITGQERMDILEQAYEIGRWEHGSFCETDAEGKTRFVPEKLVARIKSLLQAGKPLDQICLTDLTNLERIEEAGEKGLEQTEEIVEKAEKKRKHKHQKPSQQPERQEQQARNPTVILEETRSELNRLSQALDELRGKKLFGKSDSKEFTAVADGLQALLELRQSGDADVLRAYYDRIVEACSGYERKNEGSTNDRMKLVTQIKNRCMEERMKL